MFEIKQNPFSLYDFLGYFIPGAIFSYGALFIYWHATQLNINLVDFLSSILSFKQAEIYIPCILIAYILGNLLSFLSSITIESYSIWTLNYPSKYLLGIKKDKYFDVKNPKPLRIIIRVTFWFFLLPVSLLDLIFGQLFKMRELYAKGLDDLLRGTIWVKIAILIKYHALIGNPSAYGKPREHDFFRYVYHYALENSPNHVPKMQNYVALYGFLRTLTFISVIFFWSFSWHILTGNFDILSLAIWIGTIVFSYFFYIAFVKFYRRFSLEALMAMSVTVKKPD